MKKGILFFTIVLLSFSSFVFFQRVSLAASPKFGGTLRVAMEGEPPTVDAHWTTATIVFTISCHFLEPLFTLDDKYSIIPMLAESYKVEGGEGSILSN